MKIFTLAILLACTLAACGGADKNTVESAPAPPEAAGDPIFNIETAPPSAQTTNRVIIKHGVDNASAATATIVAASKVGVQLTLQHKTGAGFYVFKLNTAMPVAQLQQVLFTIMQQDPNIVVAEPDFMVKPMNMNWVVPNDSFYKQQTYLQNNVNGIYASTIWNRTKGVGVKVAVLDTGILQHKDIVGNLLPGYDFISDSGVAADGGGRDADPTDVGDWAPAAACGTTLDTSSSWHGTRTAGLIAAVGNNGEGIVGVAPQAKIVPVRVLGRCGGYVSDIADAIEWSAGVVRPAFPTNPNPAQVITMAFSFSGVPSCPQILKDAIAQASLMNNGTTTLVTAAGNYNNNANNNIPGNCSVGSNLINVAATYLSGKASYASTGTSVTISAPGGDNPPSNITPSRNPIISLSNSGLTTAGSNNYSYRVGSSSSAALVGGVIAAMYGINKDLTAAQVKSIITSSARFTQQNICNGLCGAGIIDAEAAVYKTMTTTPYPVPTSSVPTFYESEPNQTYANALYMVKGADAIGQISNDSDKDCYKVQVNPWDTFVFSLTPSTKYAASKLEIFMSTGELISAVNGEVAKPVTVTVKNNKGVTGYWMACASKASGLISPYRLTVR